jgi:hypothetical protein
VNNVFRQTCIVSDKKRRFKDELGEQFINEPDNFEIVILYFLNKDFRFQKKNPPWILPVTGGLLLAMRQPSDYSLPAALDPWLCDPVFHSGLPFFIYCYIL